MGSVVELAVDDPYVTNICVGFDQVDSVKPPVQVNVHTLRMTFVFSALKFFKAS